jgi:toxin CptA
MRNWHNCSTRSAPCRCEWRPSRWQALVMMALGLGAAIALMDCALPRLYAAPAALCVLAVCVWRCRCELRRPPRHLLVPCAPSPVLVDGAPVTAVELLERGPLTLLRFRQGRRRGSCLFWPDTLDSGQRRELRLAVRTHAVSRDAPTVAP